MMKANETPSGVIVLCKSLRFIRFEIVFKMLLKFMGMENDKNLVSTLM